MNTAIQFKDAMDVHAHSGREVYISDWVAIEQKRIDLFAEATGDFQWIHVDADRAAAEGPYGGTIAHGFLTLSMLGGFYEAFLAHSLPFCGMGLNYGLNKVRFTAPVKVGSRLRCRLSLIKVEDVDSGLRLTFRVTTDIEGQERPACVAESIVQRQFKQ